MSAIVVFIRVNSSQAPTTFYSTVPVLRRNIFEQNPSFDVHVGVKAKRERGR